MTDVNQPAQPAPATAAPKGGRFSRWVSIIAAIVALVLGGAKLSEMFVLPGCDSSRALNAIRSIFKDKNLPEPTLTDAKIAGGPSNENNCEAAYAMPNEKGALSYRVFWDGWSAKVMITKAEAR